MNRYRRPVLVAALAVAALAQNPVALRADEPVVPAGSDTTRATTPAQTPDPRAFSNPVLSPAQQDSADTKFRKELEYARIDSLHLNESAKLFLHAVPHQMRRTPAQVALQVRDCDSLVTAVLPGEWDVFLIAAGHDLVNGVAFSFGWPGMKDPMAGVQPIEAMLELDAAPRDDAQARAATPGASLNVAGTRLIGKLITEQPTSLAQLLDLPPTDTREKALGLIEWLREDYQKHNTIQWSILRQTDDLWLGTCGLHAWDQSNRRAEIGYHILPGYWGQGYATEATRAMLRWGFENLNLHRIQSDCTEGNLASERVMLKCGFTYEGLWRESCWEHERFVNIKQFGLLRREFT